jgi:predicted dehydrogenase
MRGLAASAHYELAAVADVKEAARDEVATAYPGVRTFASHDEMFRECPTDVVCVSTWAPSHLEVTQAALELDLKGILVEKPLADNLQDGERIVAAVRQKNLPMAVPHGLLFADHSREILGLVHGGEIGALKLVSIECSGWDIINAGIHWLNYAVTLVGDDPFDRVLAACDTGTRTYRDAMQVETLAATYAQTQSGVRVVMNTGDYVKLSSGGKGTLFRLVGTEGSIEFYGWEPRYRVQNAAHPRGRAVEVTPSDGRPHHQRCLEALAGQMDRGEPDYGVTESSLRALELVEAAYLSNRHRCAVRLPLASFEPPPPSDWDPGLPYGWEGGGRDGRKLPPSDD